MIVRRLRADDRTAWLALWEGYLSFYKTALTPAVTALTFQRLIDPGAPMFGLAAELEGRLAGFAHCLLHPGTWSKADLCYLEDLFVDAALRGRGIGRALIEAIYAEADAHGWDRVYWHTHETNTAAQALYDRVAVRDGFIRYRR